MKTLSERRSWAAAAILLCGLTVPVAADGQADEAKVTVWSGEVALDRNYEVPEGYTLRIEPGTVIETGEGGWVKLEVKGTLEAAGTKDKPIEFRTTRSHGWAGIHFTGTAAGGRVEHCLIREGRLAAIHCEGASPIIRNVRIVNKGTQSVGIICRKGARPAIENCEITNVPVALLCEGAAPKVAGSTFTDCPIGVQLLGFRPGDPRPQIAGNQAVRCGLALLDEQKDPPAAWHLAYQSQLLSRAVQLHVGSSGGRDVVTVYGVGARGEVGEIHALDFAAGKFTVTTTAAGSVPPSNEGSTLIDRLQGADGTECRLVTVRPGASLFGREGCMDTPTAFVLVVAGAGNEARVLWQSPRIDRGSVRCSFADADGDGVKEIVICTGRWCEGKGHILIYRPGPPPATRPSTAPATRPAGG